MSLGSYDITEGPVYYYLVLGILVLVYLLCRFLVRSQFSLKMPLVPVTATSKPSFCRPAESAR